MASMLSFSTFHHILRLSLSWEKYQEQKVENLHTEVVIAGQKFSD